MPRAYRQSAPTFPHGGLADLHLANRCNLDFEVAEPMADMGWLQRFIKRSAANIKTGITIDLAKRFGHDE